MTCTNVLGYTRYKQHYLTTKLEFLGCYIALFSSNKTSLGFAMILFSGILRATPSVSLSTLSSTSFTVVRTTNLSITARSLYFSWSINLASFLFCLTCSLTAKTGISQYAWPRMIRSWVGNDRRIPLWHCIRELKLSKHLPEQYFEGRIMTRQDVRDTFGSFGTEST